MVRTSLWTSHLLFAAIVDEKMASQRRLRQTISPAPSPYPQMSQQLKQESVTNLQHFACLLVCHSENILRFSQAHSIPVNLPTDILCVLAHYITMLMQCLNRPRLSFQTPNKLRKWRRRRTILKFNHNFTGVVQRIHVCRSTRGTAEYRACKGTESTGYKVRNVHWTGLVEARLTATCDLRLDDTEFESLQRQEIFSSPKRPHWIQGPASLPTTHSAGTPCYFTGREMTSIRMSGAILLHPLLHYLHGEDSRDSFVSEPLQVIMWPTYNVASEIWGRVSVYCGDHTDFKILYTRPSLSAVRTQRFRKFASSPQE
jgi:hypothetical protein